MGCGDWDDEEPSKKDIRSGIIAGFCGIIFGIGFFLALFFQYHNSPPFAVFVSGAVVTIIFGFFLAWIGYDNGEWKTSLWTVIMGIVLMAAITQL